MRLRTMKKFDWIRICTICEIFFMVWYKANVEATDITDNAVHLNISEAYLDVEINDTVYLKCSGAPPLTWEYFHPLGHEPFNAFELVEIPNAFGNESVAQYTFLSEDGTGRYICYNDDYNSSVYIFVNGDQLMISDLGEVLHPGEVNFIPCFPTASNVSMTLWKIGSTRKQIHLEFDPTLGFIVTTVSAEFDGHFECVAEYEGRKKANAIQLTRFEPTASIPQIYINDNNATYVMVGSSFSLECFIQTDKLTKYRSDWDYPAKGADRANETREYSVVNYRNERNETYILRISNASKADEGSYRCTALDHSKRKNFAEVNVTVYATPPNITFSFDCEKEEITKSRSETVKFIAGYDVFPPFSDIRIVWKKDGRPIEHDFRHLTQNSKSAFSLEISNLSGNDSGLYTVTTNVSGELTQKLFLLRVQDIPIVNISRNPSCCYSSGQNYILYCEVTGYPSPMISWSWKPSCFDIVSLCNSSDETNTWQTFEGYYITNNSRIGMINKKESIISTLSIVANKSGYYKCDAENLFGTSGKEFMFIISDVKEGFEITCEDAYPEVNSHFNATCKASLVLYSDLHWEWIPEFSNQSLVIVTNKPDYSEVSISLQLEVENISVNNSGTYVCIANFRDSGVTDEKSILVKVQDAGLTIKSDLKGSDLNMKLFLIPAFLGAFMVILVVAYVIKICYYEENKVVLQDFNQNFFQGNMDFFDSNLPLDEQVDMLPYDEKWEFPRDKLKLGRTLGQGAFGRVVKAEAFEITEDRRSTTVAVKMLKERTDVNQQKSLMDELKILIHLGHHVNIVNLMGAVTKNTQKDGLMVIVEYCRYGNMRQYLHRHRDSFINEIDPETGRIRPTSDVVFTKGESFIYDFNSDRMQHSTSSSSGVFSVHNPNYRTRERNTISSHPRSFVSSQTAQYSASSSTTSGSVFHNYYRTDSQEHIITTSDLLCYAFQCARGMDYLASRKLIHRDLAARNVLLADDKIVKICDFGLAKDCYKYSNYIKKGEGPLPIKWMSIESIWDHIFTTKSDVWSFGILMWEFFSLGGNPYPGIHVDEDFYKKLKAGYRMEKPELCPDFAYQIMMDCWNVDPEKRPDFSQISDTIGDYLEESVKQHYIDVNDPYMEMNRKMKTPDYSNIERTECEEEQNNPYVNSKVQDTNEPYDIPGVCRSIYNEPVPAEPMEIVPMIQLETFTEKPSHPCRTTELLQVNGRNLVDYLQMKHSGKVPENI